jgi:hypothetical protein
MEMVRQDAGGVRFERQARLDCTINLPQAFDMPDKKLAVPVSQHNREKEDPAARFLGGEIATSPDYRMRGGPRAQNRPDAVPRCRALQGDFAHPTS